MKTRGLFSRKRRGLVISSLMARDGERCAICGGRLDRAIQDPESPELITFDHILPRSLGGLDEIRNLRLAHRRCNSLRADAYDPEFDL